MMTTVVKLVSMLLLAGVASADPKMELDLTSDSIPGAGSHVASVYGGYVVTFVTHPDANNNQHVYLQGYNEDGVRMGDSVVICQIQKKTTIPEIAGGGFSNRFKVIFEFDYEIFTVDGLLFEYGIELLSAPCPAGTDNRVRATSHRMRIASSPDASLFVVASSRYDGMETRGIFLRLYSGEEIFSEPNLVHVSKHQLMSQSNPDVTILDDMTIVVVWTDTHAHGIYMMRYSREGYPLSRAMRVTRFVGQASDPTVTSLSNGGYVIGWKDRSTHWYPDVNGRRLTFTESFLQVYDITGKATGEPFLVNQNAGKKGDVMSVIGCQDATMWVTYTVNGIVYAKHFDTSGKMVQKEVVIHGHVTLSHQHLRIGIARLGETGLIVTFGTGLSMPIATYHWNGEDNSNLYDPQAPKRVGVEDFYKFHNITSLPSSNTSVDQIKL